MKTIVPTLVLGAAVAAVAQQKPEQVSPERARTNFGRQIVLAADDVRAFPDAPPGFDKRATNGSAVCISPAQTTKVRA